VLEGSPARAGSVQVRGFFTHIIFAPFFSLHSVAAGELKKKRATFLQKVLKVPPQTWPKHKL
jgi:hypothetical protein